MANVVTRIPNRPIFAFPWRNARLFVLTSVSLIAFLVSLFCFASPPRGYVARSVLGLRLQASDSRISSAASLEDLSQIRDEILSREQLGAALVQVGPPPSADRDCAAEFPSAAELDYVRQRVRIVPDTSDNVDEARLILTFTGLDSRWSVLLVDQLTAQALARLDERASSSASHDNSFPEQETLAEALRKEQAARRALDDFLESHFDALNRPGKPATEADAAPKGNSKLATLPVPHINPKWQGLREQLTTLVAQRERILLDRTEEHPEAKEASVKIEALKRHLDETPKFLTDEESPPPAAARKSEEVIGPVQFTAPDSPSGAGREYERLLGEVEQAREDREAAERIAAALPSSSPQGTASAAVVRGRIVSTGHVSQTLREAPSIGRLTILALFSIFLGACVAALFRTSKAIPAYTTLTEIERDLALPVAGVVAPSPPFAAALSR